jgi:hypothetical protein
VPIPPIENEFKLFFFHSSPLIYRTGVLSCLGDNFFKKTKKMLDMPHGGIVCSNSPVECFLKYQDASSPKAAHIPVSRLFS